ncbi:ATP synthase F0 subunit A [Candidatus Gottesmanbacteria bacterium RBG_16_52_11]|uniref:ATP synthase subunit a n=1 Tax=Candidatus Gottesmanbacteria bacterium RBG_16_52_11 TaxID=1798374 RepID=A0A1F5YQC8_9BACT|nr:MAG: ATP synthase F0 subunit A [Candidatus Gottesmanbacteria bacterium RBG_16_52_11]
MLHISLAAETLFHLGPLPVTNSLLMTWLVMAVLTLLAYAVTRNLKRIPTSFQLIFELAVGGLHDFFGRILGKFTDTLYPLVATLFLFIILSNWMGLLPGVGTVGFYREKEHAVNVNPPPPGHSGQIYVAYASESTEPVTQVQERAAPGTVSDPEAAAKDKDSEPSRIFVPLLRAPTADLNMTLGLGLIAFFTIQYFGFKASGLAYGKKFINLTNPIFFFVGFLEIISDISKIISFAFRLFGNIFAGEVLLAVIAYLAPFFLPIPFLALELFVGLIQALVFAMLTAVFIQMAASHGDHGAGTEHA